MITSFKIAPLISLTSSSIARGSDGLSPGAFSCSWQACAKEVGACGPGVGSPRGSKQTFARRDQLTLVIPDASQSTG